MSIEMRTLPALLSLATLSGFARGQTATVTTSADVVDVPSTATLAELPGPDGVVSLREALRATDNTPGRQTIGFAIPEDDWYLPNIFPGQVLIQGSFNWSAFDTVTIDGTTQTAFTGDTYPDGWEINLYGLQLNLNGDDCEVFGLNESNVTVFGSRADIHDNTGGMYIQLYNGSGSVIRDNEAWTIKLQTSNDNVIVRNTTDRIRIWGGAVPSVNNRIGGPDVADRNFITGWGNYGEHGSPAGTTLEISHTRDTLVQNNYIGTTPDGMSIGNQASTVGIGITNDNVDLIVRDNLIAIHAVHAAGGGDYGAAVYLESYDGGDGIYLFGNTLGLNAAGEPLLGAVNGILVSRYAVEFAQNVHIGGPNPGDGNVIAGHVESGVLMMNGPGIVPAGAIRLSGNSMYANGDIGVDLMPDTWTFGPTPNDPLDADQGANGLQNYPVVDTALLNGAVIDLSGSLASAPLGTYTIELFASPACDPSGFGPAQVFLGSTTVVADVAGLATFDVSVPALVPEGWLVTSTATREAVGATSELSACTPIAVGATSFCDGADGALAFCPCANPGAPDTGCDNAQGTGGVRAYVSARDTSAQSCTLTGAGFSPLGTPTAIVIRGDTLEATPQALFDGVRCVGLPGLTRLGATTAFGGTSTHAFGHGAGPGAYHYQIWYRNTPSTFCDSTAAANLSNGQTIVW